MKKITLLLPLFAVALMASSCSKDSDPMQATDQSGATDGAYLSLSISTPLGSAVSARADLDDAPGTAEESAVASIKLIIFDKAYNYIGISESSTPTSTNLFKFEVAPDAYRFFVIANPTTAINKALMNISGNWNTVSAALQSVLKLDSRTDIASYTTNNAFPMVNAGSYSDNVETVLVRPLDAELVDGKISTDETDPSEVVVRVDRMVAKFTAVVGSNFVVGDERTAVGDTSATPKGTVDGIRLNVVNKMSYIYSHINKVNAVGNDYRIDPNMSVGNPEAKPQGEETELTTNFFWLHNYESPSFNAPGSSEYVFENTASGGDFFNYNNLTQLVVKATYVPTGQTTPSTLPSGQGFVTELNHDPSDLDSWFMINVTGFGTMQMTFSGVQSYYNAIATGGTGYGKDEATCNKMDIQLRHMLASAANLGALAGADLNTVTWGDSNLSCAILNSIPNGGYVAATVDDEENYIVQFFQFGLNYYDIFIQHDSAEEIGHLGRWGMVRNNQYTLSINSITGPGYPYIPDPTDPDIKDPKNPDPKDPEPADKGMAYIDATIVVNPWTMWTQDVDLN